MKNEGNPWSRPGTWILAYLSAPKITKIYMRRNGKLSLVSSLIICHLQRDLWGDWLLAIRSVVFWGVGFDVFFLHLDMLASTNPLPLNKRVSPLGVRGGMYFRVTDTMKRGFCLGLGYFVSLILSFPSVSGAVARDMQFLAGGFGSQWVLWTEHRCWIAVGM